MLSEQYLWYFFSFPFQQLNELTVGGLFIEFYAGGRQRLLSIYLNAVRYNALWPITTCQTSMASLSAEASKKLCLITFPRINVGFNDLPENYQGQLDVNVAARLIWSLEFLGTGEADRKERLRVNVQAADWQTAQTWIILF